MARRGSLGTAVLLLACASSVQAQGVPPQSPTETPHAAPDASQTSPNIPPASRSVSFAEVVERARANPPAVLSALATLERVQAEEFVARGAYLPTLTLELREALGYNNSPYLPGVRYKSTSLSTTGSAIVDYAIIDAKRASDVKAAELAADAQKHTSEAARRVAVEAAAALYFRALAAIELITDAELTLTRRTAQHDSISALSRAGVRPGVDEQRAAVEVVVAQATVELRKVELQALEAALSAALGEDPLMPVRAQSSANDALGVALTPRDAVSVALAHRPEVHTSEAQLRAAEARDQSAKNAKLPTLGAAGQAQLTHADVLTGQGLDGENYNASLWLYLRWNALDATVWRRTKVTSAAIVEAERTLTVVQLRVRDEVVTAAFAAQGAKVKLDQTEQVLAGAQVTRISQNERYSAGVATLLELLDAEALEQAARLARIEAQREYDIARTRLLSACGTIAKLGSQR